MTSEELAEYVGQFIGACQGRILGVGNQQYSFGDRQTFEDLPLTELLIMLQEELQDVAVYAAMLDIRISRRLDGLTGEAQPDTQV